MLYLGCIEKLNIKRKFFVVKRRKSKKIDVAEVVLKGRQRLNTVIYEGFKSTREAKDFAFSRMREIKGDK